MRPAFIIILLIGLFLPARGQDKPSIFKLLDSLGEVRIALAYPFDSLYKTNQSEIDATITIETAKGLLLKDEPIALKLRGKFRRMKCEMPPLEINFKKSTLKKLGLNDHDEIKLVTHCLNDEEGQENLEEEFLCYAVYQSLTPYAYRTVWLNAQYQDRLNRKNNIKTVAFLVEPDDDLASRLSLTECKRYNIREDSINYESYALTAAFNCLIGNMDWSLIMARNVKLFVDSTHTYFVVPFDFDYSNVVGASYRRETRPAEMKHTYDRLYTGEYFSGRSGAMLKALLAYEEKVMQTIDMLPNPMTASRRKQIAKYFSGWFEEVRKTPEEDIPFGTIFSYKAGL